MSSVRTVTGCTDAVTCQRMVWLHCVSFSHPHTFTHPHATSGVGGTGALGASAPVKIVVSTPTLIALSCSARTDVLSCSVGTDGVDGYRIAGNLCGCKKFCIRFRRNFHDFYFRVSRAQQLTTPLSATLLCIVFTSMKN